MNKNNMSDMTVRKNRHFFFFSDVVIPILLFVLSAFIFRNTKLDMTIQSMFYSPPSGWFLNDNPLVQAIYHFGNIPALLLSLAGLVLFGLSFQTMKWVKWRKVGLFLVLAMLLGPGLIINVVLKDNWGRPRPRNITEFGGKYAFEKVLSIDKTSPGLSFPCGHASMGFFLFVPWFVLRKKHKGLAALSLTVGISYGLAIGIVRIAQGGHYASDVIISGILTYLIGTGIFYALRLNRAVWYYPKHENINSKQRVMVTVTVSILFFFLIIGVVLATPYSQKKSYTSALSSQQPQKVTDLTLKLYSAELKLIPSDSLKVSYNTQGFGFPRSSLITRFTEQIVTDTLQIGFTQTKKGFFTELDNELNAFFNYHGSNKINVTLNKGTATIVLPDSLDSLILNLEINEGKLDLDLPSGFKPRIKLLGGFKLTDKTGFNSGDNIYVNQNFKVNIIVREGEVILH